MVQQKPIFDDIAEVYDSTRNVVVAEEIIALSEALKGCRSILDIGVGTGRISKPLQDNGYEVTGIDISVKMLEKAREKGVRNLVVGDAKNLPFLDKSFDASIIVHVFRFVEDRAKMMSEAGRVSRNIVLSLIKERTSEPSGSSFDWSSIMKLYSDLREKYGYPLNSQRSVMRNWESVISREFPPKMKIKIIEKKEIRKPEDMIERFRHYSRFVSPSKQIPQDILDEILESVNSYILNGNFKPLERTVVEYLVVWDPDELTKYCSEIL